MYITSLSSFLIGCNTVLLPWLHLHNVVNCPVPRSSTASSSVTGNTTRLATSGAMNCFCKQLARNSYTARRCVSKTIIYLGLWSEYILVYNYNKLSLSLLPTQQTTSHCDRMLQLSTVNWTDYVMCPRFRRSTRNTVCSVLYCEVTLSQFDDA